MPVEVAAKKKAPKRGKVEVVADEDFDNGFEEEIEEAGDQHIAPAGGADLEVVQEKVTVPVVEEKKPAKTYQAP